MNIRYRATVVAALVAVLALSGCGDSSGGTLAGSPDDPQALATEPPEIVTVDYDEMVEEWRHHTETLKLPPGAEWPPPPPELEPEPDAEGVLRGHSYEEGVGKSLADGQWWCAWAREWLAQRGVNADREAAALATLHTFPDTHQYLNAMDSHSQEWYDSMLEAADLGDPTLIANDVELNCR